MSSVIDKKNSKHDLIERIQGLARNRCRTSIFVSAWQLPLRSEKTEVRHRFLGSLTPISTRSRWSRESCPAILLALRMSVATSSGVQPAQPAPLLPCTRDSWLPSHRQSRLRPSESLCWQAYHRRYRASRSFAISAFRSKVFRKIFYCTTDRKWRHSAHCT